MTDDTATESDCRAAAIALILAHDRLHRAIAAVSPEAGQDLLCVLRLAGARPVATIVESDGAFHVEAGLVDRDTGKNLSTYAADFVRSDAAFAARTVQ